MIKEVETITYRIMYFVTLIYFAEAPIDTLFPKDGPDISNYLAIISEIEAEADITLHHIPMRKTDWKPEIPKDSDGTIIYCTPDFQAVSELISMNQEAILDKPLLLITLDFDVQRGGTLEKDLQDLAEEYRGRYKRITLDSKDLFWAMREFGSLLVSSEARDDE